MLLAGCGTKPQATPAITTSPAPVPMTENGKAIVYFTETISPESLQAIYDALGRKATGKVAVKISTGEQGGENYLHPELIGDFIKSVGGKIVECNTAYGGSRQETAKHRKTIENHGFNAIGGVDIMDEDGEVSIRYQPVPDCSRTTSSARTCWATTSWWCSAISRDMPWQDSAAHSRTSR